jgi:glycosyltransferase involved in cell wall biosynthesis
MKKALTVSIVIPVYNEQHHLKACLDSITEQSILPNEVIVVDNNSTDESINIARSYPFVRVVKELQQGVMWGRNAGFDAAKYDLIGRIDADTQLPDDWINKGEEGTEDDGIDPQVGARLMPSVAGMLNGAVKVIGQTYVQEIFLEDKTRKVEYRMRIGPHAYYTTKMRNPLGTTIPDHVVDATYQKIASLMSQGEVKPVRRSISKEKE